MRDAIAVIMFLATFSVLGFYGGVVATGWPTSMNMIAWALVAGMIAGGAALIPFLAAMQKPAENGVQ